MKSDSKSVKAIAIVTMAFLPLATIAVRNLSFHMLLRQSLTKGVGSLWLPVFQLRCQQQEDLGCE